MEKYKLEKKLNLHRLGIVLCFPGARSAIARRLGLPGCRLHRVGVKKEYMWAERLKINHNRCAT